MEEIFRKKKEEKVEITNSYRFDVKLNFGRVCYLPLYFMIRNKCLKRCTESVRF